MSRDVKTGMLIGLVLVIIGVVIISTWPEGSVESRMMEGGANHIVEPPENDDDESGVGIVEETPTETVDESSGLAETVDEASGLDDSSDDEVERAAEYVVEEASNNPPVDTSPRIHIVADNENLSTIAMLHYGDANKWRLIADANKDVIKDVNRLSPGMRLVIPRP